MPTVLYVKLTKEGVTRDGSGRVECPECGEKGLIPGKHAGMVPSTDAHEFWDRDQHVWCSSCNTTYTFGELANKLIAKGEQGNVPQPDYGR